MQRLEVSGAVRPIYVSLGVKRLTLWHWNYFFNFSTPCTQNVNNTGTKQVSIMKQTAF